jgi:hypothetical protein
VPERQPFPSQGSARSRLVTPTRRWQATERPVLPDLHRRIRHHVASLNFKRPSTLRSLKGIRGPSAVARTPQDCRFGRSTTPTRPPEEGFADMVAVPTYSLRQKSRRRPMRETCFANNRHPKPATSVNGARQPPHGKAAQKISCPAAIEFCESWSPPLRFVALRRLRRTTATYTECTTPGCATPSGFLSLLTSCSVRHLSSPISCW